MIILFYLVVILVISFHFYLKRQFSYFEKHGILHKKPHWFLGNTTEAGRTLHVFDVIRNYYQDFKGKDVIAGFYCWFDTVYIILDLEVAKHILIKDFNNFPNRGGYYNMKDEPISENITFIENEKWRFIRNKFSPAFTSGKNKAMFEVIRAKGKNYIQAIERASKAGAIDFDDVSQRYTLDFISYVAFGMEANTLNGENPELMHFSKQAFGGESISLFHFAFATMFPKVARFLHVRSFSKELSEYFFEVVGKNIKYRESVGDKRNDILNMLIQIKNKGCIDGEINTDNKKFTWNQTIGQAFIFFIGGSHTSSRTIAFTMYELAKNPDIQESLRSEVLEYMEKSNGDLTYDDINEMPYLEQVTNEVLRMYPIGFVHSRVALEDYKIPNSKHVIPAGKHIWIPTTGYHFDDKYWKNPYTFDPEHFSKEQVRNRPALAFIPFGEGPRNCVAWRLGGLNIKYGIAMILKNFRIVPDEQLTKPIKIKPNNIQVGPDGGVWVRVEKL